jgi:hypothetical protein
MQELESRIPKDNPEKDLLEDVCNLLGTRQEDLLTYLQTELLGLGQQRNV